LSFGIPSASDQASNVLDTLIKTYARRSGVDATSFSDQQRSDEIQFGVSLSLGYLSKAVHPTDEKRFEAIISVLCQGIKKTSR
jgi:hypothetical protein